MECYLCKYCKAVTNFPVVGPCEEAPEGEHEWVTGEMVAGEVQMDWERDPDSLTPATN